MARNLLSKSGLTTAEAAKYVVVVDDSDTIRETVLELLREEGISAIGFENGAAALDHLRSGAALPIAIVTDLMMPVLDGWDLVARLREDTNLAHIRVVAMTANPMCRGPKAVRVLRKPFHVIDLLGALQNA